MTDKEKIKGQANIDISNLHKAQEQGVITEFGKGKLEALEGIVDFIDSLQEEPVNIWHDASVKPNIKEKGGIFVITASNGEYIGSRYYSHNDGTIIFGNYDKWAYLNDLANLSNVERTVKDRKEESVSEDLEEASKEWLRPQLDKSYANYGETKMMELTHFDGYAMLDAIEFGAKWKAENLWKPADGNDLPEIDREVIALLDNGKVVYAHRPSAYWDGKDIVTGKVTRNYPKTYDKGGWNIPNIKWWLDCSLPNMEED